MSARASGEPTTGRRALLAGTGGLLLAAPLAAEAQPRGRLATIGFLTPGPAAAAPQLLDAFLAAEALVIVADVLTWRTRQEIVGFAAKPAG